MHKVKQELKDMPENYIIRIHWDNGLTSFMHTYSLDEKEAWPLWHQTIDCNAAHAMEIELLLYDKPARDRGRAESVGNLWTKEDEYVDDDFCGKNWEVRKVVTYKSAWDAYQARCKANEHCNKYGLEVGYGVE